MRAAYLPPFDPMADERRQAVVNTADAFNLRSDNILVTSGAAFILNGLDTRVDELSSEQFDVDAIFDTVDDETHATYGMLFRHKIAGTSPEPSISRPTLPVGPMELAKDKWPICFGLVDEVPTTIVEGIQVPTIETLVRSKSRANRHKDNVGLIQAYLFGRQEGTITTEDHIWQQELPQVIETIESRNHIIPGLNKLPWLSSLIDLHFDVPELADITTFDNKT